MRSPPATRRRAFNPQARALAPVYAEAIGLLRAGSARSRALLLAFAGGAFAFSRVRPHFRARTRVERVVMAVLLLASLIAILTTSASSSRCCSNRCASSRWSRRSSSCSALNWSPQTAIRADQAGSSGAFGAIPLFWGTIFIGAIIAMIVAIPLGLMSAIYLTQYAQPARARAG